MRVILQKHQKNIAKNCGFHHLCYNYVSVYPFLKLIIYSESLFQVLQHGAIVRALPSSAWRELRVLKNINIQSILSYKCI